MEDERGINDCLVQFRRQPPMKTRSADDSALMRARRESREVWEGQVWSYMKVLKSRLNIRAF